MAVTISGLVVRQTESKHENFFITATNKSNACLLMSISMARIL
jgi:hypothetical protein